MRNDVIDTVADRMLADAKGEYVHPKTWTEQRVRDELPAIKVRNNCGGIVDGRITGRLNKFATVTISGPCADYSGEFAWATLAHCLNTGKPVRF